MNDNLDKEIWLLIMADSTNDNKWDVFGVYSSCELAKTAKDSQLIKDGLHKGMYEGRRPDLLYDEAVIVLRLLDHNLPR